jgi:DNA sulfur modification protein DndE
MINMNFKQIKLSQEATRCCQLFKHRTKLTPNITCRLGLSLSLAEENPPSLELYASDDSGQAINRYTFLGEHEDMLLSLLQMWCYEKNVSEDNYYSYLMAHINRGTEMLSNRVKGLNELVNLLGDDNE